MDDIRHQMHALFGLTQCICNNWLKYIPHKWIVLSAHADWLGRRWAIHFRAADEKQNGFRRFIVTSKVSFGAASYSACVVYTKTIIGCLNSTGGCQADYWLCAVHVLALSWTSINCLAPNSSQTRCVWGWYVTWTNMFSRIIRQMGDVNIIFRKIKCTYIKK